MKRFLSLCSGIEACSVAWGALGWEAAAFAEIEAFPCAVLAHHYPQTPNLGDITKFHEWPDIGSIDVMVGGTPCQAFSVAGNREGLADARGNLCLTFCEIADRYAPQWVLWENVPGVLSDRSNAFGCFLARLCGAGEPIEPPKGKWTDAGVVSGPSRTVAWRVQDAQYHGLAQRRRRVFVLAVAGSGNWRCAAALFPVGDGLCWNPAPRGKAGEDTARSLRAQSQSSHREDSDNFIPSQPVSHCLNAGGMGRQDYETETLVAATIKRDYGKGYSDGEMSGNLVAFDTTQLTSSANRSNPLPGDPCHPLAAGDHAPAIAFQESQSGFHAQEMHATLDANNGSRRHNGAVTTAGVRRLTPRECCRLQGFPDDYLDITFRGKPAADGPKYKALGNSMATNVMKWIGQRIEFVNANY
jgi:DNA (cytosine-5)-methyltransferase 1